MVKKSFVISLLAKDIKKFENDLKIKAIEHQTRFQGLHEKRAEILADFYKAVISFEMYFKEHAHPTNQKLTSDEDLPHSREIASRYDYLEKAYLENKIYFNMETCRLIDALVNALSDIKEFSHTMKIGLTTGESQRAIRIPSYQGIAEKISPVKLQVENSFRKVLGANDQS